MNHGPTRTRCANACVDRTGICCDAACAANGCASYGDAASCRVVIVSGLYYTRLEAASPWSLAALSPI